MTGANFEYISRKTVSMSFSSLGMVSCCCRSPNPAPRSTHPSSSNPLMNARNSFVLFEILRSIVSAKDSGFFSAAAVERKHLKHNASISNRKAQPAMKGLEKRGIGSVCPYLLDARLSSLSSSLSWLLSCAFFLLLLRLKG
jgi:hypothetical protein